MSNNEAYSLQQVWKGYSSANFLEAALDLQATIKLYMWAQDSKGTIVSVAMVGSTEGKGTHIYRIYTIPKFQQEQQKYQDHFIVTLKQMISAGFSHAPFISK